MSELIWSMDELARFARFEDSEVRYWAIDRLIRHYPEDCCDKIAHGLIDDHEATPAMVARHLGEHGGPEHHAVLVRGLRVLRGATPGLCLQALARLGYPGTVDLARAALEAEEPNESAFGIIIEALADLGTTDACELVRETTDRRVELLADPMALRGVLKIVDADEIPDTLAKFLTALQWRGTNRAGEAFRALMDALQIDDAGWCFRTGPSGRIELRKTIKAVESGYDCDILTAMGETTLKQLGQRFRAGGLADIVRSLADWTCAETRKLTDDPEDPLPRRIEAAIGAFATPQSLRDVERLGHQFQQWVLGFQLSAAFAVARYQNFALSLRRARGHLDRLLTLAEVETAFTLADLPAAIAVVCRDDAEKAQRAQDWCLRMLEAQGPFFPKVVALETLGELRAIHFVPEIMEYLADENSYVFGASERALSRMGEAVIPAAGSMIESGHVDPDSAHSLLVLLCDLGTATAYEAVATYLEWFMAEVGPGHTAEWVSLFGLEELIEPLRDWLEEDPALVGHGLLLLGAIHNVRIPEEDEILQAIEDERARRDREQREDEGEGGPEDGDYVM
ncbi:hypothetical protein ABI59_08575 [Acidobacteria bacterium Mor1]|nr:hypothetical protein ABI59_08575 [Acidobacteria bacterium Mor1]